MGDLLAESLHGLPDHATDCGLQGKRLPRRNFSTAGETVRLIAEGTLAGIMAISGNECAEPVGKCRLGRDAEHSAGGAPPRNVQGLSASFGPTQTLRMAWTACRNECAERAGKCRLGGNAEHSANGAPARIVQGLSASAGPSQTLRVAWTACRSEYAECVSRCRLGVSTVAKVAYDIAWALSRPRAGRVGNAAKVAYYITSALSRL